MNYLKGVRNFPYSKRKQFGTRGTQRGMRKGMIFGRPLEMWHLRCSLRQFSVYVWAFVMSMNPLTWSHQEIWAFSSPTVMVDLLRPWCILLRVLNHRLRQKSTQHVQRSGYHRHLGAHMRHSFVRISGAEVENRYSEVEISLILASRIRSGLWKCAAILSRKCDCFTNWNMGSITSTITAVQAWRLNIGTLKMGKSEPATL